MTGSLVITRIDHSCHLIQTGAGPVAEMARKAGFSNVRALEPWQSAQVGDLAVNAAPGKHGVYEVTYVISGGGRSVYFA
ncbi:MAG: MBL fold metallo-hydrolase, partial [Trebonia sp.]